MDLDFYINFDFYRSTKVFLDWKINSIKIIFKKETFGFLACFGAQTMEFRRVNNLENDAKLCILKSYPIWKKRIILIMHHIMMP